MFHRTSALSLNNMNRPPLRGLSVQNENTLTTSISNIKNNSLNSSSNNIHSTPKKQHQQQQQQQQRTQRRALGDISNSKNANSNNKGGFGLAQGGKTGIPTLKKQSNGLSSTPRSQIPRLATLSSSKKSSSTVTKKPTATIPSKSSSSKPLSSSSSWNNNNNSSTSQRVQSSIVPTRSSSSNTVTSKPKLAPAPAIVPKKPSSNVAVVPTTTTTTTKNSIVPLRREPVDDVELPAGRTWLQQQKHGDFRHDDYDYDDDWSASSSVDSEIYKTTTMWEDWRSSLRQQYVDEELELERRDDDDDRKEVQAHIEKVMKEQTAGLECLLDFVDNLDLDDHRFVDDDTDEWSLPASSVLGIQEEEEKKNLDEIDETLLFEI